MVNSLLRRFLPDPVPCANADRLLMSGYCWPWWSAPLRTELLPAAAFAGGTLASPILLPAPIQTTRADQVITS
jgi:hypothetical protein